MQQEVHTEQKNLDAKYEISDFEFESLDFKPVNQGLGFHGEKETTMTVQTMAKRSRAVGTRKVTSQVSNTKLNHSPESLSLDSLGSSLEAFYGTPKKTQEPVAKASKVKKEVVIKDADLIPQFLGFTTDLLAITASSLLTFSFFHFIAFASLDKEAFKSFLTMNIDLFGLLSFVLFFTYFTLMDGVGTLGKKLFSMKVISSRDEQVTMTQLFNRSVLCAFSSIIFFIPCFMNLHGKISQTRVVKA